MKHRLMLLAGLAVTVFGLSSTPAFSQSKGRGEIGLVGIKLYDSGLKVVQIYGSPSTIEVVGVGGGSIGPSGGGGARPGMGGRGGPGPMGGGGGGGKGLPGPGIDNVRPGSFGDFGFANEMLSFQDGGMAPPMDNSGRSQAAPAGGGGGFGAAASSGGIKFTRWVFNRPGSKYAFVLDKYNRVVQIEAIGISDPKVRSARGVGFGTSFSQIIKLYGAPDGYEINGDNIVLRYLNRNKVAFRLSKLGNNKAHQVTGVVVAGGKA